MKKYLSPVPYFQHQFVSGKVTHKSYCLVATGPSVPEQNLLETIEVSSYYRCRLWDAAEYQAHGSDETMKVVQRIGRTGKGVRAVKKAIGKRKRSAIPEGWESEEDEPGSEIEAGQRSMRRSVQQAPFGTPGTTPSFPKSLRRRSPVDYAGQQQDSNSDTEDDELLRRFQTPQPLKLPNADSSAEPLPEAALLEAEPIATSSNKHPPSTEPAVVDLISDSSEDEQYSKSALLKELRCSSIMARFFDKQRQLGEPVPLSKMLTLDKLMAKAAMKYVMPRDDLVLRLSFNDNEPVGIMKGELGDYAAFMKTVLEDACWKVKSEGSGRKDVVCYFDVALL